MAILEDSRSNGHIRSIELLSDAIKVLINRVTDLTQTMDSHATDIDTLNDTMREVLDVMRRGEP
jgi:hypothetical protein